MSHIEDNSNIVIGLEQSEIEEDDKSSISSLISQEITALKHALDEQHKQHDEQQKLMTEYLIKMSEQMTCLVNKPREIEDWPSKTEVSSILRLPCTSEEIESQCIGHALSTRSGRTALPQIQRRYRPRYTDLKDLAGPF